MHQSDGLGSRTPSNDFVDQSKLLKRRGRTLVRQSQERTKHKWMGIAVGRVCVNCSEAQAKGEFQEDTPCRRVG